MDRIRLKKIAKAYQHELSQMLLQDVKDPRLEGVYVTHVEVSPDLHQARVYYGFSGDKERERAVVKGLRKSKGYLRKQLGTRVRLKYTPDLEFQLDVTEESVQKVESLFHQIDEENKAKTEKGDS